MRRALFVPYLVGIEIYNVGINARVEGLGFVPYLVGIEIEKKIRQCKLGALFVPYLVGIEIRNKHNRYLYLVPSLYLTL